MKNTRRQSSFQSDFSKYLTKFAYTIHILLYLRGTVIYTHLYTIYVYHIYIIYIT